MKVLITFCFSLLLISCASIDKAESELHFDLDINAYPELSDQERGFWFGYTVGLGFCIDKNNASYNSYPIKCELSALTGMAQMFENEQKKSSYKNTYFQNLLNVYKEGYLESYAWSYYNQSQWEPPKNLGEFKLWKLKNLSNHKAELKLLGVLK